MFYWCHQESESIGKCNTEAELDQQMETPLVEPIDESEYINLKNAGWCYE